MKSSSNNNQLLRIDIQKIDHYLKSKHSQQNIQILVKSNISEYLNQLQVIENEILLIQTFLQEKYPNIPLSTIILTLRNTYQQKAKQIKKSHLYEILLNQQDQKNIDKIIEITQNMIVNEKFWMQEDQQQQQQQAQVQQNHLQQKQFNYLIIQEEKQIQERQKPIQTELIFEQQAVDIIQNQQQCYQNQNIQLQYFEGDIISNAISKAKEERQYLNQKKVIHVYTKKGYGIQKYAQYLQKRKMDQKQWSFYMNTLKNNNNYQKYLDQATKITLITIIDCLKISFKSNKNITIFQNSIKSEEKFSYLVKQIHLLCENQCNQFKNCMRIIYDLKSDQKPTIRSLKEFVDKISQKISK